VRVRAMQRCLPPPACSAAVQRMLRIRVRVVRDTSHVTRAHSASSCCKRRQEVSLQCNEWTRMVRPTTIANQMPGPLLPLLLLLLLLLPPPPLMTHMKGVPPPRL